MFKRYTTPDAEPATIETLAFLEAPQSAEAEAIRSLRTRIMAQHVEQGRHTLAICAATADVGCSFVAANLAVACAHIGVKTAIIDCDLRAPALAGLLGLPPNRSGLAEHLAKRDVGYEETLQHSALPMLSAVTAGALVENPQELLATARFKAFVAQLKRAFDLVIFDTTPANYCTDAQRVATVAEYALIVARKHNSFVADVSTLSRLLRADHAAVVGTVLTVF